MRWTGAFSGVSYDAPISTFIFIAASGFTLPHGREYKRRTKLRQWQFLPRPSESWVTPARLVILQIRAGDATYVPSARWVTRIVVTKDAGWPSN
jgi:hypothetical protein